LAFATNVKGKSKWENKNDQGNGEDAYKIMKTNTFHYYGKVGHMKKHCKKTLAYKKSNQEGPQQKAHVTEHTKEKKSSFYVFMATTQSYKSRSSAWFIDLGASRHFTNMQYWFTENFSSSSKDSVIFSSGEEYKIVGTGNVQISFGGKMLMFLNVYYILGMEINMFSVVHVMRHDPDLDVNFRNH